MIAPEQETDNSLPDESQQMDESMMAEMND